MLRYLITDRQSAGGLDQLVKCLQRAIDAGVELVQIREKDLSARQLMALIAALDRKHARILVNGRMDVALASGADGVHLPSDSPAPNLFRQLAPAGFLIGVSCHSVQQVLLAEQGDADFTVLGTIFATPSKLAYGEPLGLRVLHEAAHSAAIPVFALGGVNDTNREACQRAGARGIAGIRLFQERFG